MYNNEAVFFAFLPLVSSCRLWSAITVCSVFAGGTAVWWKRRSKPSWGTGGSLRQWWRKLPVSNWQTDTLSHVTRFLLPCHVRSSSLLTLTFEELCVIVKSLCPDPEDMSACRVIVNLGCPLNTDKAPDFTHLCQWTFFVCLRLLTQNNTRSLLHVALFLTDWRGVMCTLPGIHYEVSLFVGFFFESSLIAVWYASSHPPHELCLQHLVQQSLLESDRSIRSSWILSLHTAV